jgi:hypothetical protein
MTRWMALGLLGAVACDEGGTELTACEGAGAPDLFVGDGGADEFLPWEEGQAIPITQSGNWGFRIELQSRGLDTTSPVSVLVRFTVGDETETQDAAAMVTFQCSGETPGWAGLFVPLDDEDQSEAGAAALSGQAFHLTASAVDAADDDATAEGTFEFSF